MSETVTSAIVSVIPGLGRFRSGGAGRVLIVFFYGYAAVVIARWPEWSGIGGYDKVSILAGLLVLYAGSAAAVWIGTGKDKRDKGIGRRFGRGGVAGAGLVIVLGAVSTALLAPLIGFGDPTAILDPVGTRFEGPSWVHPFGTDRFGRDVWTRLLYGARISLGVGITATLFSTVLGTVLGAVAGFSGGGVDNILMRVVDGLLAFPRVLFVLTLVALNSHSTALLISAIAFTGWMGLARLVRGEVLRVKALEFVEAAVATGIGRSRLVFRHVLPNAIGPVIVSATLNIGAVILLESYLSFLGLGVPAPAASWGAMVRDGGDALLNAWWVSAFPAAAITVSVVAFNLVGDGVRDALDVRSAPEH